MLGQPGGADPSAGWAGLWLIPHVGAWPSSFAHSPGHMVHMGGEEDDTYYEQHITHEKTETKRLQGCSQSEP